MYDIGYRIAALTLYQNVRSLRRVSQLLRHQNNSIGIATLARWCRRIQPQTWKPKKRVITQELVHIIQGIMKHSPCLSCTHVLEVLNSDHGIHVSRQLIHLIVRKTLNYTYKRTRKRGRTNSADRLTKLNQFIHIVKHFRDTNRLVAVDECGFDQRCMPVYAYSPKGRPAILEYTPNTTDRTRVSMIMGINYDTGSYCTRLSNTPCNSRDFADFLKNLPFSGGTGIILDNASIHRTQLVKSVAREREYTLIYTPPYTPEANPIEMVFGVIKNSFYRLRYDSRFCSTMDTVENAMKCSVHPKGVCSTFDSSIRQIQSISMDHECVE